MRKKWRRIFSIFLAMAVMITAVAFDSPKAQAEEAAPWTGVSAADWMANIDGSTKLSAINIPGTHDSTTQYVEGVAVLGDGFTKCQDKSVTEQLELGVRYLDIRLDGSSNDGNLYCVHSKYKCYEDSGKKTQLELQKVLQDCYAFLDAHPTETIIMRMKEDNGSIGDKALQTYIHADINKNPKYWFVTNGRPSLEETRGKIVLARYYQHGYADGVAENQAGLNFSKWPDQSGSSASSPAYVKVENTGIGAASLWIQDWYGLAAGNKWNAVKEGLDSPPNAEKPDFTYFLNYLSSAGTMTKPSSIADTVNKNFSNYTMAYGKHYGWIVMDFVTEELARHVFESNTCDILGGLKAAVSKAKAIRDDAANGKYNMETLDAAIKAAEDFIAQNGNNSSLTSEDIQNMIESLQTESSKTFPLKSMEDLDKDLLGHYPLTNDSKDISGKGNHGTATGVTFSERTGAQFSGGNALSSYISLPPAMFNRSQDANGMTVSFWVKDNQGANSNLFGFGASTACSSGKHFIVNMNDGGKISASACPNGWGTDPNKIFVDAPSAGTWMYLTVVMEGKTLTVYKDGIETGSVTEDYSLAEMGNNVFAYIGNAVYAHNPYGGDKDFSGNVKDFRVYGCALAPTQIEAVYESEEPPTDEKPTYTVSFDAGNGSGVKTVTVEEGEKVQAISEPTRDGYTFVGWFVEGANSAFDFNTAIMKDTVLTAKWNKNEEPGNPGGDNPGDNTGDNPGDNTGGDNSGDNTGGDNPGGDNSGDNPGDNTGDNTGGDNTGNTPGGDNPGDNPGGDTPGGDKQDKIQVAISGATITVEKATYTGKLLAPKVTVVCNGKTLTEKKDYTVAYSNNKNVGVGTATIQGIGDYVGQKSVSFQICPQKNKISKLRNTAGCKIVVNFKKAAGATGYEISYATNKKFKSAKKKTSKKTTYTLKKLKKGKTYYVRVRSYKKVGKSTMIYSDYCKTVKIKVKR